MEITTILPYLTAASILISIGTAVSVFVKADAKANGRTLADHEKRIQAVETELRHLPDRAMVHDLQLTLKDIQIEMASIKAATEQSTRTSRRVEEYLLKKGEA